ncbi:hypothetical protein [Candidatus Uabimicrobium sp. HlEnr_7]|uniref:hypothetical protein n=1 Tax=Candidatus Uabimicrobium helgolandensis TaxID=3095367 RepID=UPI0035562F8E
MIKWLIEKLHFGPIKTALCFLVGGIIIYMGTAELYIALTNEQTLVAKCNQLTSENAKQSWYTIENCHVDYTLSIVVEDNVYVPIYSSPTKDVKVRKVLEITDEKRKKFIIMFLNKSADERKKLVKENSSELSYQGKLSGMILSSFAETSEQRPNIRNKLAMSHGKQTQDAFIIFIENQIPKPLEQSIFLVVGIIALLLGVFNVRRTIKAIKNGNEYNSDDDSSDEYEHDGGFDDDDSSDEYEHDGDFDDDADDSSDEYADVEDNETKDDDDPDGQNILTKFLANGFLFLLGIGLTMTGIDSLYVGFANLKQSSVEYSTLVSDSAPAWIKITNSKLDYKKAILQGPNVYVPIFSAENDKDEKIQIVLKLNDQEKIFQAFHILRSDKKQDALQVDLEGYVVSGLEAFLDDSVDLVKETFVEKNYKIADNLKIIHERRVPTWEGFIKLIVGIGILCLLWSIVRKYGFL